MIDDQKNSELSPKKDAEKSVEDHDDYYANKDLNYYKSRFDDNIENYFNAASVSISAIKCEYCHKKFPFKNLLYSYLENFDKERSRRQTKCSLRHVSEEVSSAISNAYIVEEIIKSIARTNNVDTNHAFHNYHYAITIVKLI